MFRNAIPVTLSLLAAAGGAVALVSEPAPPPVPGPGGVIDTVRKFIAAMDKCDVRTLVTILDVQRGGGGMVVTPDADSKWGFKEAKGARSPRFVDVNWDGTAFSEHDRKEFVHRVRAGISRAKTKPRRMHSNILSIRADCPSADVSYAVIEFERSYTIAGKAQGSERLVATALLRHAKQKKDSDPEFRIFQWHASRLTPPDVTSKKKG